MFSPATQYSMFCVILVEIEEKYFFKNKYVLGFLCQLICQSSDNMSSLCGVYVCLRMSDFSDETTRPRDMLSFLKDSLSI